MPEEKSDDEIQEFSTSSMEGTATKLDNPNALVEADEPTEDNLRLYISSQVIETWKAQHNSDIRLRQTYAA